jgi:hypothetical protein
MMTNKQLADRVTVFEAARRDFVDTMHRELEESEARADAVREVLARNGFPAPPRAESRPTLAVVQRPVAEDRPRTLRGAVLAAVLAAPPGGMTFREVCERVAALRDGRDPYHPSVSSYLCELRGAGMIRSTMIGRQNLYRAA